MYIQICVYNDVYHKETVLYLDVRLFLFTEGGGGGGGVDGEPQHSQVTCIYPNLCYKEVCHKERVLYFDVRLFLFTKSNSSVHSILKFNIF